MSSSDVLTLSLTQEVRLFSRTDAASGCYQTASEVVRAGLRLLTMADPPRSIEQASRLAKGACGRIYSL